MVQLLCRICLYSTFLFPRISRDLFQAKEFPVIYVANHVSFFDLFISGTILPGFPRGFETMEHFKKPIFGWYIKLFGQIPLDLTNRLSMKKSLHDGINLLKQGRRNIMIMPEGKRTRNGRLEPFKNGAFYLSRKSGFPIVPVIYKNIFAKNNANSLLIIPGTIEVILADPIYPGNFSCDKEMADYTRNIMENILNSK